MQHHAADEDERTVTVIYATETGNAQDVAERLARHFRRLHFHPRVFDIDTYSPEELISETLVVFVISTAGSGKEPRSMTAFWNMLLRSDLPEDLFEDLHYAVFGLGDSSYEKFCWPAKLLSRRLAHLGAQEICPRGEGDEQHRLGTDGGLIKWIPDLTDALLQLCPLPEGVEIPSEDSLPPPRIAVLDVPSTEVVEADPLLNDEAYHLVNITRNDRITAPDWYQDVRHIELEFPIDMRYKAGDVAVIHPEVPDADVEAFLTSMGYSNIADEPFRIKHVYPDQSLPDHLPAVVTLRRLFTRHLDITAVPRRSFFALLRHFATDDLEREKLDEFLSEEGAEDLYDYCQRVRRTIKEVMEEFRSCKVPKEYVFDLFPPLRPREFSIASSSLRHPRQVHLCVAIVNYRTKLKIPRRGVATTYLASLRPGDKLIVGVKSGGLITLPKDSSTPVICVGPGTGIAPSRAIIEERTLLGSIENTLYQGCRSASKDQHYVDEFKTLEQKGQLRYRVACSRDGPEGLPRKYVQHLIAEDSKRIWELIGERKAWIYISGASNKMPTAVKAAIREAVQEHGGQTEEEAKEYVAAMEREGRLIEDCWS
ncbi:riboflavin synthase domain-like protein [Panus rudis PR-1116 ss-1]|nr:riboflavin synthase domain-like protein [Panus rudis PR-1116 ss-1]